MIRSLYEPGVEGIYDMPAEAYHAAPGVSHSMLCHLNPPARLPVYLQRRDVEPTYEMVLGTLVHSCVLEPGKPLPQLALQPETYPPEDKKWNGNANWCKEWKKEQRRLGKIIVTRKDQGDIDGCVNAMGEDAYCQEAFASGHSEVSLFSRVTLDGGVEVLRKARLDFVPKGNALVDVKRVMEGGASPEMFSKFLYDRNYFTQAEWYLRLWNALMPSEPKTCFIFFAVEGAAPYLIGRYVVDEETLAFARERNDARLDLYARCHTSGHWPGYSEGFQPIGIPGWAKRKEAA